MKTYDLETLLTRESLNNQLSTGSRLQLSSLQRAYWIGEQTSFDLHVHPHLYLEIELSDCDSKALYQARNTLLARHPMLQAKVLPTAEIVVRDRLFDSDIPEHDLSQMNHEEVTKQLEQIRKRLYRSDIKAETPPNIHLEITRLKNVTRIHINIDLLFLDGSSVRTVLSELSQMYTKTHHKWSEKSFDLSRYELHRRQKQASERYQRTKNYWFERLRTLPGGPLLPLKSNSIPRRSHLVRRRHVLSAIQWQIITKRAKEQDINPTTLLLTAFSLIVAYWSKNQHFSLTMMVQNRDPEFGDLSGVVGNFASTVLVEVNFSEAKSFAQHTYDIHRQVFRDVTRSMVCGLEVLQERNRQQGSAFYASSPVAFVSMLDKPDESVAPGIFQLEGENMVFCGLETPQVLLDHQAISRTDGGVALIWDTVDSAFEEGILNDMFDAYVSLVSRLDQEQTWQESYFDFRSPQQQASHREYNQVQAPLTEQCLHEYLYEQTQKTPDKTLLIDSRRTFSYQQATELSNRIAWTLRQQYQVKPNELIAVYASKGWEQVIAAQAILTSGAAYVPLYPSFPDNRKQDILERCGCRLVLTNSAHLNDSCLKGVEKIAVDVSDNLVTNCDNLPRIQSPNDLAYVIFTSGSTGKPKGVVLNHLGPVNTIEDINRRFGITSQDTIFGISELTFDLSVYDIFGTMATGATLVLPPEGINREPALCAQLCKQHGVTVWNSVPALAQLLVQYFESNSLTSDLSVRLFMMSGDWIPVRLPGKLKELFSSRTISLGGATEGSIWSIYYDIDRVDPNWKSIPYGYPLSNQEFYVLDSRKQARPDNVSGELYIGGIGVAQGYWKDEQKTAHSYLEHPVTHERIYRTGDWGVRRSDGYIEFLGREDGQVKVRGYRIELGEIESTLQRHPAVVNAAVKVIGEQPQNAYLAAYLIAKNETEVDWQEVKQYAEEFLPDYMIPTRFIFLEQFPLGATGKVDRKALPIPSDYQHSQNSEPPETDTERNLARLWSEILGIETLMREDNFFELGGNSFSAIRLMALIADTFDLNIPVTTLLQHSTLKALSQFIDEHYQTGVDSAETCLVSITGHQSKPPIFWFHPSGGGILCYKDLAQLLSERFGCLALEASGTSRQKSQLSLSEMTKLYLKELHSANPSGPYHLGGWSMGGVIAYEAAQQLTKQGIKVDSLVLIDSPAPLRQEATEFKQLISWFVSDLAEVDQDLALNCLQEENNSTNLLLQALTEAQQKHWLPAGNIQDLISLFEIFRSNIEALHSYQALPLKAEIPCLVVMATQNVEERVASNSIEVWHSLLPKTTWFSELEGNHYSLLKSPTVNQLAKLILEHSQNQY
ncbi:MAG: amino acid adenylation domain-containing protein [Okeania sp. SIO2F4]|uniref:non-ribosomal peptide synthetase n=1 Tax=Okeania sp. SIO2F4 TaxID=2607790 RepID=UPI00142CE78E|nr:amino acid adenylation domain-containing protein [Okeania sp. SIO2F4]NES02647.1 amino acid adenylation domain-containing protein [Okeania sp. SIO2F4]